MPLLPTTSAPPHRHARAKPVGSQRVREPLDRFIRKRRKHPYKDRSGSVAMMMRKNYLTQASVEQLSQGEAEELVQAHEIEVPIETHMEVEPEEDIEMDIETDGDQIYSLAETIEAVDESEKRMKEAVDEFEEGAKEAVDESEEGAKEAVDEPEKQAKEAVDESGEQPSSSQQEKKKPDSEIKEHQQIYAALTRKKGKKQKRPVASPDTLVINVDDSDDDLTLSQHGDDIWQEIGTLTLTTKEKQSVQNTSGWLNDNIVNSAQYLIHQQFLEINGLQNTLLSNTLGFQMAPPFVQVLNVNENHWVTVACIDQLHNTVRIYDSLGSRNMSLQMKEDLASIMCTKKESFFVCFESVGRQLDGSSCALYAIAFAFDLCERKHDPRAMRYSADLMRQHLLSCLDSSSMSSFPISGKRRVPAVGVLDSIAVWCHCKLPWNDQQQEVAQIECGYCFGWFHHPGCEENT